MTTHSPAARDWIEEALCDLPKVLTVKEALGVLRMSSRNLYRLVQLGRIHAVRPSEVGSSRLLIPRTSLESYLRALEVK
jgi:excisionase family DNA binding protein